MENQRKKNEEVPKKEEEIMSGKREGRERGRKGKIGRSVGRGWGKKKKN
jgi:hypothetical protein